MRRFDVLERGNLAALLGLRRVPAELCEQGINLIDRAGVDLVQCALEIVDPGER